MKKVIKALLAVIAVIVLLVVAALALHPLWVGSVVKAVAEKVGPKFTGTPITLSACGVNLYSGHFELSGFELSNPSGCSEKAAVSVGSLKVDFDTLSALKDVILVRDIDVSGIFASYLKGESGKYNFTEIADNAKAATGGSDAAAEPKPETESPAAEQSEAEPASGKKVVIERLAVGDVKLAIFGMKIPLVPGTIELKDIGKESQGVSFKDAWTEALAKVKESAGLAGDGLSSLGAMGSDLGKKGLDLGQKGLDAGLEGLKGALDSAKNLNVDGAKDILKDTGKSLESVGKGFKGLFK